MVTSEAIELANARWCPVDGTTLPSWAPSNQVYCRDSCKKAASRANEGERVDRIAGMLREPPPVRAYAYDLTNGVDPMGDTWYKRLRFVMRHEPTDAAWLGPAVLFAMAKPLPAGTCRFCVARVEAWAMHEKPPAYNARTRRALGDPCPSCAKELGLKPGRQAVTAGAGSRRHRSTGRCVCGRTDAHASARACGGR